jgi:hypothetical protein
MGGVELGGVDLASGKCERQPLRNADVDRCAKHGNGGADRKRHRRSADDYDSAGGGAGHRPDGARPAADAIAHADAVTGSASIAHADAVTGSASIADTDPNADPDAVRLRHLTGEQQRRLG